MSDDGQVFEAVRALFEAGEYVDYRVDEPRILTHLGHKTAEPRLGDNQFDYYRGTPRYRLALAGGYLRPLPTLTPAPLEAVLECESVIGARLPDLLRRCYLELGDGGFGPNKGILGLGGGHSTREHPGGGTVAGEWLSQCHRWPAPLQSRFTSLVPICEWGCNVVSFIDVSDAEYRMWGFEPNIIDHHETDGSPYIEDIETALYREEFGFTEWLRRWTDGTLHQPHLVLDEDTGQWRGPTDADGPCWSRYAEGESWTVTLTDPPF